RRQVRGIRIVRSTMPDTPEQFVAALPMMCMQGQGIVRGFAIGRAAIMSAASLEVAHYRIADTEVDAECERLRSALQRASAELQRLADTLPDDAPRELGPLLTVHGLLLDDPLLLEQTC